MRLNTTVGKITPEFSINNWTYLVFGRNPRSAVPYLLGVHGAEGEVDMRPVERVALIELDAHGVLVDRLDELDMGGRVAHTLRHVEHGSEPLDVGLVLGVESLDELGGDGRHLFNK